VVRRQTANLLFVSSILTGASFCARDRRRVGLSLLALTVACAHTGGESADDPRSWYMGRLRVHPAGSSPIAKGQLPGLHPLRQDDPNGAWIYVPARVADSANLPLVVLLHGAGGTAERVIQNLVRPADQTGMIVVAPKSRAATWDIIGGYYGPDVASIDSVLVEVTRAYSIDPRRIYLAGFSDGASYALGLGRLNGDVFSKIAAFSPGILLPVTPRGSPRIFISHGTRDQILPIEQASRRFVPELRRQGFRVEYREFDGPHAVPNEIADAAARWLVAR
jgi:phospholipase/carboxylesterase